MFSSFTRCEYFSLIIALYDIAFIKHFGMIIYKIISDMILINMPICERKMIILIFFVLLAWLVCSRMIQFSFSFCVACEA